MKKYTKILPRKYIESKLEDLKSNHYAPVIVSDKETCRDLLESHLKLLEKLETITDFCTRSSSLPNGLSRLIIREIYK